jgi:hypothetical protein
MKGADGLNVRAYRPSLHSETLEHCAPPMKEAEMRTLPVRSARAVLGLSASSALSR